MAPFRPILLLVLGACAEPALRQDLDPLFRTIETGSALEAMEASEKLARAYDDAHLARLQKALDTAPRRTLPLLGDLSTEGSAKLLLDRLPHFLHDADREAARLAMVSVGLRKLRAATPLLLDHANEPAALRALGRIWEQSLDAPALARKDEIDRLTALAVAHRAAMGANATIEACEAMLRIMGRAELEDFLGKHAGAKFAARRLCVEATGRRGFDPVKGARVHEALLSSPDADLVAVILAESPHALREELVRSFLKDERPVKDGKRLKDHAEARLKRPLKR